MKKRCFLGIDTSNYMTSICFIDSERNIIFEAKQLLHVEQGERGLQQSQALFQHIKNIPELMKKVAGIENYECSGIAVSKAPRPVENSYMPVFQAGLAVAESIAATFTVPLFYTTHQEGHIAAGIYSSPEPMIKNRFLAVHLSGGTSEILTVEQVEDQYLIEQIGGTLDLHAGQLVDRIGVLLGYPFPAGKYLEELAKTQISDFERIPSSVRNYSFHFSGAEAAAKKKIEKGVPSAEIARSIEHLIATSISKAIIHAIKENYPKDVLVVGGVAQNQYIRNQLVKKVEHHTVGGHLYFADPAYSGDNAFGVANIALDQFQKTYQSVLSKS